MDVKSDVPFNASWCSNEDVPDVGGSAAGALGAPSRSEVDQSFKVTSQQSSPSQQCT